MKNIHEKYMLKAIELAKKGVGKVNPNPLVGCVIVKNNKIISQGYHKKFGSFHAEIEAINKVKDKKKLRGASIYITLEPCCHYEKTPPCVNEIIKYKFKKVYIGIKDPNNLVSGKSIKILKDNNIEVYENILKESCTDLIKIFNKYITKKTPYILVKYAMTLDGKVETSNNMSKWITNEKSRNNVHKTRNEYSAIMVGVNTIINDDPKLTSRIKNSRSPIRIVCDTNLRTPLNSYVVKTSKEIKTIIATSTNCDNKIQKYKNFGCEIIIVQKFNNRICLKSLIKELAKRNIDSVLIEGGPTLLGSVFDQQIADELNIYISNKIFGGSGKSPILGKGITNIDNTFKLKDIKIQKFNDNFLISGKLKKQ